MQLGHESSNRLKPTVDQQLIDGAQLHGRRTENWRLAGELQPTNEVLSAKGYWVTVTSVSSIYRKTAVFNFEVADNHSYFVGDAQILAHNECWMSLKDAARKLGNDLLKASKESGAGTGARSGQHGRPFFEAASQLRQLLKENANNWLPEFKEEVKKVIKEYTQRGRDINHPYK